jgi:hypothetical protein
MTFTENQPIHLDVQALYTRVNERAEVIANAQAEAGILPELDVDTTASVGYTVADVLDYDCRQNNSERRRAIIRITDVATTRGEIAQARISANPVVKRALNTFLKDLDKAITRAESNRVSLVSRPLRTVLASPVQYGELGLGHIGDAISQYNSLVSLNADDLSVDMNNDGTRVLIKQGENVVGTIRTVFARLGNGNLEPRFVPSFGDYLEGYNNRRLYNHLSSISKTLDVPVATAGRGRFDEKPLCTLADAVVAFSQIVVNFRSLALSILEGSILTKIQEFADALGEPVTIKSGESEIVINPDLVRAA